jgi:peptidyl-dipeptidase Dcp
MREAMQWQWFAVFVAAVIIVACSDDNEMSQVPAGPDTNPLLEAWDTPFGTPPFDAIESEHYLPALRAGMAEQKKEIEAITANPGEPTFANTVEAFEASGGTYGRVSRVFNAVNGAHSDDVTKETAKVIAPESAAHKDDIYLNADLSVLIRTHNPVSG